MRSSTTTIETGRVRLRSGITPTATIRAQRTSGTNNRTNNSNSNTTSSNSSSHHRISNHLSTDVPPIPPRTRQTNGGINLSRSQGIHANIHGQNGSNANTGMNQTRNHQRTPAQSLSRTTPTFTQPHSRRSLNASANISNNSSQTSRTRTRATPTNSSSNTTSSNTTANSSNNSTANHTNNNYNANRNTSDGQLFPRPPPAAEAVRRRPQRNSISTTNSTSPSTRSNSNSHSITQNSTISNPTISNSNSESSTRVTNYNRVPQVRISISPRSSAVQPPRHSPPVPTGEPIIPVPNQQTRILESQNRTPPRQPPPSENVGSTREPQVLLRSSPNVFTNNTTTTNRATTLNTNTSNTNMQNANITRTNANHRQNTTQQPTRPTLANVGTRVAPNMNTRNPQNDDITVNVLDEDNHFGLFDELFSILDNFPINLVPLIPLMFESRFGSFLERVIPLYLANYERNQIIRAMDESMREAANPRPEPPKNLKLINHIISNEDLQNERECSICLNDFVAGEQTVMLKCGHFFHKDCLMPWFVDHHTCPTCRQNVDDGYINGNCENK